MNSSFGGEHLSRRHFLGGLTRCMGGICAAGTLGQTLPALAGRPDPSPARAPTQTPTRDPAQTAAREVDFYEKLDAGAVRCGVCPRHCQLADGETGYCRARTNIGGQHVNRGYAKPCILNVDPVEKLPLNHFRPGSQALTIAVGGCNLRCLYCQNWQQSQKSPTELKTFDLAPADAIAAARKKKIDTIAFGYTEPVAFLEYATDVAAAARQANLHVVVATAGYVEPEPLLKLAPHVSAFAVTLKGFDEDFYQRVTSAHLEPVLRTIETIKTRTSCWLELVNLVVPTYNDDIECIARMGDWIHQKVGDDVPLHFERFVPMYQLENLPRTPVQTLESAVKAAQSAGLRYVYTSNIAPHEGTNTYCANCHTRVIQRLGFKILEDHLNHGLCPKCNRHLPGIWT